MEEIEIKFLEVDIPVLEEKLRELGAEKVGEFFYKRTHFDYPDLRLDKNGSWIRLRSDGVTTTLTYKSIENFISHEEVTKDCVILEKEIDVSNFEMTRDIFLSIGFIEKGYQENKRIRYVLNDVEIDIDSWPKIPPYVEIEGPTIEKVNHVANLLGFSLDESVRYSAGKIYQRHYGINLHEYTRFTFDEQIKR